MNSTSTLNFFFSQTDTLGMILFVMLAIMSLLSWYCIIYKAIRLWDLKRVTQRFIHDFWACSSDLERRNFADDSEKRAAARLAQVSLSVHEDLQGSGKGCDDILLRCMSRVVGEESAKLDNGQTLLASVAAVAPFVGLFGTVWGVHHALASIGQAATATLDQVAGPVGEALIMTALGLAVAIPAVLAYNFFSRASQTMLAEMDSFAHDLHHYLMTGKPMQQ